MSSWNISIASQLQTVYPSQGEGEFGLAVPAGDGNVLAVAANNGFYNIKAQPPAVPVQASAFVYLVEPVKDQRELLWGDGVAGVGDGDINLGAGFPEAQTQLAAGRAKFDGVINEVVGHLGDGVQLTLGIDGIFREVHCHIQVLVENLLRCNYGKLGNYIEKNKKRNVESVFKKSDIKGFNNEGQFIEPMRLFSGDISTFKIVSKDDFVYNSRINSTIKKLSIVINESSDLIVSPAYESFRVINNNELYPFYLYMLLQRESFARKVLFNSFGSSTIVFGFDGLCEIDIPIPNYAQQKNIAYIYRAYKERWNLNEKLKAQIKDICPILIKGSIEEARKAKEA